MGSTTLTIKEARKKLDNGEITSVELTQNCLDEIKKKDGEIHAYLEVFDDAALEQAREADKRIKKGNAAPLTGIPLAVKDNILIKGRIASAASKILENYHATYDATVIAKLKGAGAIFLGRTNMDEFAMGSSTEGSAFGVTKNPHDTDRIPGGSSGGSAASVASGMSLAALGSDTAGSARQPASFCGIVGMKPTYGGVSRHGLMALGSSLDVISPMARTVGDVEILFEAIKGQDSMDSTTLRADLYPKRDLGSVKKIGVPKDFLKVGGIDPKTLKNFESALDKLEDLGYKIIDISLPNAKYAVPAYYVLMPAEASTNLARYDGVKYGLHEEGDDLIGDYFRTRHEGFGTEPKRRIIIGTHVLSSGYYDAYYNKADAVLRVMASDFDKAFGSVDVIATPTTPSPAFKIGEKINDPVQMYLTDLFTVPANHTGLPAISLPSGFVKEGGKKLPLGLQLFAPHMNEHILFSVGKRFLDEV